MYDMIMEKKKSTTTKKTPELIREYSKTEGQLTYKVNDFLQIQTNIVNSSLTKDQRQFNEEMTGFSTNSARKTRYPR